MDYNTAISEVVSNVTVPQGAVMTVIDEYDGFVPFKRLDVLGSTYNDSKANYDTYLEVLAENKTTKIVYQLQPTIANDTIFVISEIYDVNQENTMISLVPIGTSYFTFMSNVMVSEGADIKVYDKLGFERTAGGIVADDKVVVTSDDGQMEKVYFFSLIDLSTGVAATGFLAYITSDVYTVNQISFMVDNVLANTSVDAFLDNVVAAEGGTAVVLNADGTDKTTGNIAEGDLVSVTSGNGETNVVYTIGELLVGIGTDHADHIKLYPNPTNSKLHIDGVRPGSRITVYNIVGVQIRSISNLVQNNVISLKNEADGVYFILISDENNAPVGSYKVLKN